MHGTTCCAISSFSHALTLIIKCNRDTPFTLSYNRLAPVAQVTIMLHSDLQQIGLVCLGTTHFINALIRQHDLAHVAVLVCVVLPRGRCPPFLTCLQSSLLPLGSSTTCCQVTSC